METIAGAPMGGEMAPQMEAMPAMSAPELAPESTLWTAETRQAHLEYLPAYGFTPEQHAQTISEIVDIGLPVNNLQSLARKPNIRGEETHLGSWWSHFGEFSLYDLLDRKFPEQRVETIAHESMHANTPLAKENDHLFGGEVERLDAEEHVLAVADQSLSTGIHLDGYHKALMDKYRRGDIDRDTFNEETSAIMAEMALTNRAGLEDVQARQHKAVDDKNRISALQGRPTDQKVDLITIDGGEDSQLTGVDKTLVKLLEGVSTYSELVDHVHNLKMSLYSPEAAKKVQYREQVRYFIKDNAIAVGGIEYILRFMKRKNHELEDSEDDLR